MDWIAKQFGVRALDFLCERREALNGTRQQFIHVILETADDVKKMQADRDGQAHVIEQFLKYLQSTESYSTSGDPLKTDVFFFDTTPIPEIIVTYRPLKGPDGKVIQEMLEEEERAVLKTVESVWTKSQSVVFYFTDAQVKENLVNGTSAKIIEQLERVNRKFGAERIPDVRFDSKESFDRDYESNWYYYWK